MPLPPFWCWFCACHDGDMRTLGGGVFGGIKAFVSGFKGGLAGEYDSRRWRFGERSPSLADIGRDRFAGVCS